MSKIEWCDKTINPIVGCSKCSPGCLHCYAETMALRLAGMMETNPCTAIKYRRVVDDKGWNGEVSTLDLEVFDRLPKKPSRVFVGSMTDLFQDAIPFWKLDELFKRIWADKTGHTFLILTKRPDRMFEFFQAKPFYQRLQKVWLGVTVCNQDEASAKIPVLLRIPLGGHFVSVEPMLGPVDLTHLSCAGREGSGVVHYYDCLRGVSQTDTTINWGEARLDWVICGGETGPAARPLNPGWAHDLKMQCLLTRTPFFFKSGGEWTKADPDLPGPGLTGKPWHHFEDGTSVCRVGKNKAGWLLNGMEIRQFPQGLLL